MQVCAELLPELPHEMHATWRFVMRLPLLIAGGTLLLLTAAPAAPPGVRVDLVLVDKSEHTLSLYAHGKLLRSYRVALGGGGLAPKTREGDRRTPEGRYRI